MPKSSRLLLTGLVWIAAFLRIPSLFNNRFHADEALFASWARLIAVWRDPLLLTQPVDKPPLIFYLQALFYPLMGPEEWAARLPNFAASLLLVPIVAVLAWYLYRDYLVSILAALFITLLPITIQFSSTAFTDPMLTVLITLSIIFIFYGPKPSTAGLLFGLAMATKYQALLFLPLVIGFAWLESWNRRLSGRWLTGFGLVILLLAIWEILRGGRFILWSQQINNFGGVRPAWSWEIFDRLLSWSQQWHMAFGGWLGVGLILFVVLVLLFHAIREKDAIAKKDLVLIIFVLGYMILHWLLAVPVWDRYILPLIPFVITLIARGINCLCHGVINGINKISNKNDSQALKQIVPITFLMIVLLVQIPGANAAKNGEWDVGGRPDADRGAWEVAEYLADEPYGTVLYDHWYSWQWRYHLFDKKVFISWFQHPQAIVDDLEVFGDKSDKRYLVLPASDEALPIIRSIDSSEYELYPILKTDSEPGMILYRIDNREELN